MSARFELYKDPVGEYRFQLRDENGRPLCISNAFRTKELCLKTIHRIKETAAEADVNEVNLFAFTEYCKC